MESTTSNELKAEIRRGLERVQTLRDELRVRTHLASMEVKQRWDALEPQLADLERIAAEATEASRRMVNDAVKALQALRDSLKKE